MSSTEIALPGLGTFGRLGESRRGIVEEYDAESGLGLTLETDGSRYRFHCSAIADGSRQIGVGTEVIFSLRLVVLGQIEAADLVSVSASSG